MSFDYYNEIASDYREFSRRKETYIEKIDEIVCFEVNKLSKAPSILDVGAGDGERGLRIAKYLQAKRCFLVEPSENLYQMCVNRNGSENSLKATAEDLDKSEIGQFDGILCLWNVLGHVDSSEGRIKSLVNLKEKLNSNGRIFIDVNNRHNAQSYGFFEVLKRKVVDTLFFDVSRGDAHFTIKYNEKEFEMKGHLFIPREIESHFQKAGLTVERRFSINYESGKVSTSPYLGQLFYILKRLT